MISIGFWFEAFTPLPEEKERVANAGDDELKSRLKGAAAGKPLYDLIKGGEAAAGPVQAGTHSLILAGGVFHALFQLVIKDTTFFLPNAPED